MTFQNFLSLYFIFFGRESHDALEWLAMSQTKMKFVFVHNKSQSCIKYHELTLNSKIYYGVSNLGMVAPPPLVHSIKCRQFSYYRCTASLVDEINRRACAGTCQGTGRICFAFVADFLDLLPPQCCPSEALHFSITSSILLSYRYEQ